MPSRWGLCATLSLALCRRQRNYIPRAEIRDTIHRSPTPVAYRTVPGRVPARDHRASIRLIFDFTTSISPLSCLTDSQLSSYTQIPHATTDTCAPCTAYAPCSVGTLRDTSRFIHKQRKTPQNRTALAARARKSQNPTRSERGAVRLSISDLPIDQPSVLSRAVRVWGPVPVFTHRPTLPWRHRGGEREIRPSTPHQCPSPEGCTAAIHAAKRLQRARRRQHSQATDRKLCEGVWRAAVSGASSPPER
jgi:hypothetical protein